MPIDLYSRGVEQISQGSYTIDDKPYLREIVIRARAGSSLIQDYRKHLLSCGASVVLSVNEVPIQVGISGDQPMSVAMNENVIVALISLNGESVDHLVETALKAAN